MRINIRKGLIRKDRTCGDRAMKTITAERNRIRNRLIQRTGATPAGEDRNLLKRMN